MTQHLRPSVPLPSDVILPADPAHALALAQELLEEPRMSNHSRGLWGYAGGTTGGRPLAIQATGIGGPSVAVVVSELASLGVERAVLLATGRALEPELVPGTIVNVARAIGADGVSAALGRPAPLPDAELLESLHRSGEPTPRVMTVTSDLYYDPDGERSRARWQREGADVSDVGTAAALAAAETMGIAAAALLVIEIGADGMRLDPELTQRQLAESGRIAADALNRQSEVSEAATLP